VIVISGAPGVEEREENLLLHHRVGAFSTQREIFERITVAATCLDDSLTAFREIDGAAALNELAAQTNLTFAAISTVSRLAGAARGAQQCGGVSSRPPRL
jgi:TPP-dependent 2-oxoacid decarboxylase